ncbi:MAG: ATP-binding cassette domain-containing protein [Lachnospiraceae bacterium]|nr:ATP-binding cassette domain-containing protein [Candidatus Colinaster equi]
MISIDKVCKSFGKKVVLKDVSFDMEEGMIVGITGRNGCGKTTLLSIIAGVERPDAGKVSGVVAGKNIGYVPQINPLLSDMSVADNLKLWGDSKENIAHIIEQYELDTILKQKVSKLSGGMKRRVAIACALVNHPRLLVLDEPTASLDIVYKRMIHAELKDYTQKGGNIIMVSHEEDELAMCDKCYYLHDGIIETYSRDRVSV